MIRGCMKPEGPIPYERAETSERIPNAREIQL